MVRIIAIDPAPSKPGTVFDGLFRHLAGNEFANRVRSLAADQATFICWDTPITGLCMSPLGAFESTTRPTTLRTLGFSGIRTTRSFYGRSKTASNQGGLNWVVRKSCYKVFPKILPQCSSRREGLNRTFYQADWYFIQSHGGL
jgi:hypothetical protein